jgi:hypothetical protein
MLMLMLMLMPRAPQSDHTDVICCAQSITSIFPSP